MKKFLILLILLSFLIPSNVSAQVRVPDVPADPRPGIGYIWGLFWGRFYVSNDLGYPDFEAVVRVCPWRTYLDPVCFTLHPYYYDFQLGRMWYESDPITTCGPDWFIWWGLWDRSTMDIRQPSNYFIPCVYLPTIKRG